MFDESRHLGLLHQIASAARSGAMSAMGTGSAAYLRLPAGLFDGDVPDRFPIGQMPAWDVGRALVVLDLNLGAPDEALFHLLAREIEPFIIGVGDVCTELNMSGQLVINPGRSV